jgi:hypothetical protein
MMLKGLILFLLVLVSCTEIRTDLADPPNLGDSGPFGQATLVLGNSAEEVYDSICSHSCNPLSKDDKLSVNAVLSGGKTQIDLSLDVDAVYETAYIISKDSDNLYQQIDFSGDAHPDSDLVSGPVYYTSGDRSISGSSELSSDSLFSGDNVVLLFYCDTVDNGYDCNNDKWVASKFTVEEDCTVCIDTGDCSEFCKEKTKPIPSSTFHFSLDGVLTDSVNGYEALVGSYNFENKQLNPESSSYHSFVDGDKILFNSIHKSANKAQFLYLPQSFNVGENDFSISYTIGIDSVTQDTPGIKRPVVLQRNNEIIFSSDYYSRTKNLKTCYGDSCLVGELGQGLHHIVFTRSGGVSSLYLDGVKVSEGQISGDFSFDRFLIGGPGGYNSGLMIGDVKFFDGYSLNKYQVSEVLS